MRPTPLTARKAGAALAALTLWATLAINQATVKHRLNNIIHIMEVDSSTIMGFQNIGRNQFTTSNILRYFTSN